MEKFIKNLIPQGKHSTLQSEIVTLINQRAKSDKIAYAFPELSCTFADRSMVPDIAVFEWRRIPIDNKIRRSTITYSRYFFRLATNCNRFI